MAGKPSGVIPGAEFQALRTFLLAQGFTAAQIAGVIGTAASGRTRSAVAIAVTTHLRTLPRQAISSSPSLASSAGAASPSGGGKK